MRENFEKIRENSAKVLRKFGENSAKIKKIISRKFRENQIKKLRK